MTLERWQHHHFILFYLFFFTQRLVGLLVKSAWWSEALPSVCPLYLCCFYSIFQNCQWVEVRLWPGV